MFTTTDQTPQLTARERRLLEALASEETMKDVAKVLGVSTRQCRRLASDLRQKIGAGTNRQAVAIAVSEGLIEPPHTNGRVGV